MDFVTFILVILGAIYTPIFTIGVLMFMVSMPITGVVVMSISLAMKYIDSIPTLPDNDQDKDQNNE
jgi:hypothetical protein